MSILQIALNNLKRRKVKMIFLTIGLVVGVSTVVGITGIVSAMRLELGNKLDAFGPNIVIVPRSEGLELNYGGDIVTDVTFEVKKLSENDLPTIRAIADGASINLISPKLISSVTLGNSKALIVGVDTKSEFAMKPWFTLKSYEASLETERAKELYQFDFPENGMVIGSNVAKNYDVKVGDIMSVNKKAFIVSGILNELGSDEDGLIYANIRTVQTMLGRLGEFSMIEVSGFCNFCPIEDMTKQLAVALPNSRVTALREAALVREETIDRFASFGFVLSMVTLLISSLVVISAMLSAVNERTLEIGIFRAIGFRKVHIIAIIFIEVIIVSFIAGILGYVLGSFISQFAGPLLAQSQNEIAGASFNQSAGVGAGMMTGGSTSLTNMKTPDLWNLSFIAPSILLSVAIATISSIFPITKASMLDPVDALRFI